MWSKTILAVGDILTAWSDWRDAGEALLNAFDTFPPMNLRESAGAYSVTLSGLMQRPLVDPEVTRTVSFAHMPGRPFSPPLRLRSSKQPRPFTGRAEV